MPFHHLFGTMHAHARRGKLARVSCVGQRPSSSPMTPETARAFAECVHAGARDRYGSPLVAHLRRVAAAVPVEARAAAWLHEALEYAEVTEDDLHAAGASEAEVGALQLLTRDLEGDDAAYLAHIARIAYARGQSGRLARIVKRVDLLDRMTHPAQHPAAPAPPPHARALHMLTQRLPGDRRTGATVAPRDEPNMPMSSTLRMAKG